MLNDVTPPKRLRPQKPKVIKPIPEPEKPSLYELAKAEDPEFKTPEEVAAEAASIEPAIVDTETLAKPWRRWWPHSRKQWLIGSVLAVVLLCGIGGALMLISKPSPAKPAPKKVVVNKVTPPAPLYSTLSGLPITDASLNSKPVTAVMVENSLEARPQSGLSQAGVVFEAQAEGGITRFMALYQDTVPTNVGPIRSARPYYVQWALGFDAAYAHVGGSPDALSDITSWGVHDMNQFYNGGSYHRIATRAAPHNVYTGIDTLNQLEAQKGYTSAFTGFPRADKPVPASQPTASTISLAVSGPLYNPQYVYNASTNSYDRSIDGTAQTDANTGKQLSPTVVIAIVVPLGRGVLDSSGAYYSDYNPLGSGAAYVFQDGGVAAGQWHKTSNTSQITFTDASGTTIPLNRGQTWITAVSATGQVSYKGAPTASAK